MPLTSAIFPKFTKQRVSKTSSYTQTTATFTDVTEMTVTLPTRTNETFKLENYERATADVAKTAG